ncbi:MAG: hypothetical protein ABL983_12550, partial [Nitrospira sp.]
LDFSKDTASACPVFAARAVNGVKNGPSPEWLQKELKQCPNSTIQRLHSSILGKSSRLVRAGFTSIG